MLPCKRWVYPWRLQALVALRVVNWVRWGKMHVCVAHPLRRAFSPWHEIGLRASSRHRRGWLSSARAPRAGRQSRRRYHIRRIRHLELKESGSIGTSALNQLCTDASFQSPVRNACVGSGIHSAIQSKVRPGDVRGLWTGDKPDHRCDLINRPVAVERHNNLLRHRPVA